MEGCSFLSVSTSVYRVGVTDAFHPRSVADPHLERTTLLKPETEL